jgi:Protein of unknown function (DUF4239)
LISILHKLSSLSIPDGVLVIVIMPTIIMLMITYLLRIYSPHLLGDKENDITGFKFSIVGSLFAIVLGFTTIVVWDRFSEAETASIDEANAVFSVYRLSRINSPYMREVAHNVINYAQLVEEKDWPAMANLNESNDVTDALNKLYESIIQLSYNDPNSAVTASAMLAEAKIISKSRRLRLHRSLGLVPDAMWVALFGGTLIMFSFLFIFSASNLMKQMVLISLLVPSIMMPLNVIIGLNYPFAGPISVGSEAMNKVFDTMVSLRRPANLDFKKFPTSIVQPSFIVPADGNDK